MPRPVDLWRPAGLSKWQSKMMWQGGIWTLGKQRALSAGSWASWLAILHNIRSHSNCLTPSKRRFPPHAGPNVGMVQMWHHHTTGLWCRINTIPTLGADHALWIWPLGTLPHHSLVLHYSLVQDPHRWACSEDTNAHCHLWNGEQVLWSKYMCASLHFESTLS